MTSRQLLARACRAEWLRLWSVRSTWWLSLAAGLAMIGIGALSSSGAEPTPGDPAWLAAAYGTVPAQIALLSIAMSAVTADYTTGGIIPTLQWTPRRLAFFAARSTVAITTVTMLGCLLGLIGALTAYAVGPPALDLPLDDGLDVLADVGLVLATGSALAVGLGFLLRNTAAGIVTVILLLLVLPGLIPQLGTTWAETVADLLPGANALFLLVGEPDDRGITDASAITTLLAWSSATLTLAWIRLQRNMP